MKTLRLLTPFFVVLLCAGVVTSCKKGSSDDAWVETKDVTFIVDKSNPENGKQYLEVIYENAGSYSVHKIKYQLITRTGGKIDTVEKIIVPDEIFKPKDRHLVPRAIGEPPATFDEVHVGKVWVVKDKE
jgi:hypothetical protein